MNAGLKHLLLLPALVGGLSSISIVWTTAQTFTTLHHFTGPSDGAYPFSGLILSGNTLYGTASQGGTSGNGAVFALDTDGNSFTNLHSFSTLTDNSNNDGARPWAGLALWGGTLYGAAQNGGNVGRGTVFAVNTSGTGFTNLHSFLVESGALTNSDGFHPIGGLILSGNSLFGTTYVGGSAGKGTVFRLNTNGTGFTNLHNFTGSDGASPRADLMLSGKILYGTAEVGGSSGNGALFTLNTDGGDFTNLHHFTALSGPASTNSDGLNPMGGLILSGSTLYGTAYVGGAPGNGTVFAINTNGTGFVSLHSFTALPVPGYSTNSDGRHPYAGLILSGNTLYGTASEGGTAGYGTVFAVNADGTGFTTLYSFTDGGDGAFPNAGLILSSNALYGTAELGGNSAKGTIFRLTLPLPQLNIIASGTNVILTWPTNAIGFTLQSTTNLVAPAAWSAVSPAPVILNGQNAVTNPASSTRRFYRLSQ